MKLSVVLPICLATAAIASPMDKRQSGMLSTLLNMLPSSYTAQAVSVQTMNPIYRPTAIRKKTRYGPFTLPANKVGIYEFFP